MKCVAKTLVSGAKSAVKTISVASKEGWKLVAQKIGLEIAKTVGKDIVAELVNIGVDQALIPKIEAAIVEKITPKINEAIENNAFIKAWLEIDATNRNSHYQLIILKLAQIAMSDEQNTSALTQIALTIADQVLCNSGGTIGTIYKIGKISTDIKEIVTYSDNFLLKFTQEIEKEVKKEEKEKAKAEKKEKKRENEISLETTQGKNLFKKFKNSLLIFSTY